MAIGQRERRELQEALVNVIGAQNADNLIEYLPPVGWADVATKQDLAALSARVDRCATKDDLAALASRVDRCATKDDLAALAARVDRCATKDDLAALAARVEGCATKDDLQTQFFRTITVMLLLFSIFTAIIKFL